ncbi:MAG: deoxyribodipyrimidine photo-lyase [Candidatus Latescibacteria bacterium]|nr:deoxyribodipyrimidine photo-lyase [Candidatus Latescibacterota bacterium]
MTVNPARTIKIKEGIRKKGPVVYWMSRDQRIHDNWALLYAQDIAHKMRVPLVIVFCLVPEFLNAGLRQYDFMLNGLEQTASTAHTYNIPFHMLFGKPEEEIHRFIDLYNCSALITDFDPLRIKAGWKALVTASITIPFYEVDSHNIVPSRIASDKQEYGAYTIRKKILSRLPEFLTEFPQITKHPFTQNNLFASYDWTTVKRHMTSNNSVLPVEWLKPGEKHAFDVLENFIGTGLPQYAVLNNDPNSQVLSNLSPYLHFGQISAQRITLEVSRRSVPMGINSEPFLEQLIVRRELADNFCYYCPYYDSFEGLPQWAQQTLNEHRDDPKEYIYNIEAFERAETHDPLWNAAQREMEIRGKMHSYLRMYWAKKILEWSINPETAIDTAIYLNDTYGLDGRDPNGYTGILWSIGGLHDRAWGERPIFGKIRYMNYNGCKRKFDTQVYIDRINLLNVK